MKTAIITDWLTQMGGAERVVLAMKELFPEAPIYTTVYNPDTVDKVFHSMDIRPSFIQKLPGAKKSYQKYLPLMPTAVEQFDLREFDLVISSSSSVAKGVITRADTVHICYCHTPMRYAWDFYHEYLNGPDVGKIKRKLIPWLMNYIRMWDRLTADRVDYFIANSQNVAKRIRKHYHRDAEVIYPPVETSFFAPVPEVEDFFLVVSRLVPYKRVDLAIQACNRLKLPLRVIGTGPEFDRLKALAGPTVQMMGRLSQEDIKWHYARCRAFLFPGEEDFGITPVEAQASGRPVIAYGRGGALETVVEGKTGLFFAEQSEASLVEALKRFDNMDFDPQTIRSHAGTFDSVIFKERLSLFIKEKVEQFFDR
ncbi:group 1 glycosyl transferase [Thermincola ferriacetica]|uniref:Group 1 glycosyl transferase n=1 Tax=Thermincola ferriacetica TaxID=281456 RepID=A0A0L6W3W0_9FIRM|nr:glycosyltransferase [Thermincola ferriacetica]KNZ70053.1 group 1 glycosyl transferase [Thermincola ferriacetica]